MELVLGASNATIRSVGRLLSEEYAAIRGVHGDVEYITDELETTYAFLLDLRTAVGSHDNRTRNWMKKIRDITFDMEDCICEYGHRLPHNSISNARCSFIIMRIYELWTWRSRRDIASKIADIKVKVQHIAERRFRYEVNNPIINSGVHATLSTIPEHHFTSHSDSNSSGAHATMYGIAEHHQVASRQLIGIKEPVGVTADMKKLEEWVDRPDKEHGVLSIIGFGGVGKTTIATALYRKVMNKFECRASVNVSQNYDKDAVLRSILKQVIPQDKDQISQKKQDRDQEEQSSMVGSLEKKNLAAHAMNTLKRIVPFIRGHKQQHIVQEKQINIETMDTDKLVQKVQEHLKEKRYLLLIDDIWSAKTWESIRLCLPLENNKCSRIIVTSRFQAVGAACSSGTNSLLHTVDFLSVVESENLFYQSVCESEKSKRSEKVQAKVPEEIWKICGGLPLALVTMAGFVACNPSKPIGDWEKVCKSVFPEPVANPSLDGVTRILDLCYNDLPGDLKTCALYLSIFPKGSKISMKRLTRRLIAEGFVSEKQGLTEEEVAETYFNHLMRRNLIRPVEHSSNGKVKSIQVHDMVVEYIVSKSREENFITVVGGHETIPVHFNKVRRVSMQSGDSKFGNLTEGMDLSRVRSLTIFGSLNQLPLRSFNNLIIQVLDLEGWKGLKQKHLKDIFNMLSLKYLSLRRTEIAKIPSTIQNLNELETLDIRETHVKELPKSVEKLKRISSILGGNKNPRKGLRLPEGRIKEPKNGTSAQQKSKDTQEKNKEGMKQLRVLSRIEIVGESTAVDGLHQMTGLKKLAIYKLNIKKDGKTFTQLHSSIMYLFSCGLQTLAINDESSDFINSLDTMSAPPRYLVALELSGMLKRPPNWISKLHTLSKLTLSVTVLRTDTFKLLKDLPSLFSLTFSFSAAKQDQDIIKEILEQNKSESDGEIFVPAGFQSLKLLRFFAPLVPKLGFGDNAMPALEMIQMRFEAFEGLFGIDTLENLREVHLRVNGLAAELKESDEAKPQEIEAPETQEAEALDTIEREEVAKITNFLVEDLKNYTTEKLKVIVDYIINA